MSDKRAMVFSNLDDALENEYDLRSWTADDIVADLLAFAHQCEGETAEALKPHVEAWLKERNNV